MPGGNPGPGVQPACWFKEAGVTGAETETCPVETGASQSPCWGLLVRVGEAVLGSGAGVPSDHASKWPELFVLLWAAPDGFLGS